MYIASSPFLDVLAVAETFHPYKPDQLLLLPPSLRDWLPEVDHLVYFVSDLLDALDLSQVYDAYTEERGYPTYHRRS